jgi:hypothetical protein
MEKIIMEGEVRIWKEAVEVGIITAFARRDWGNCKNLRIPSQ